MAKWREVRLGDVANINKKSISLNYEGMIRYIDIASVGTRVLSSINAINFSDAPSRARRIVKKGDTIISSVRPNLKSFYHFFDDIPDNTICSTGFIVLSGKKEVNDEFLYYYLTQDSFVDYLVNIAKGSAYPAVSVDDLKKSKVTIPDLPTQEKIANILSNYDKLIENNNRRIKLLEQAAEELYKEWFVRMRFPGHENAKFANGIPEEWEVRLYGSFGKVETGKTPSTLVSDNYGGNIPFIKTPDMHNQTFCITTDESLSELGHSTQPKKLIPENCICVSCIGTAGIVSITSKPSHTNQQINSLIPSDYKIVPWLYYMTKSLKETIELFGSTGATMSNLSKGKLEKLKVLTPSNNYILEYSNIVEPILEKVHSLSKQNQNLIKQRDLLLPRLMSGKMEV